MKWLILLLGIACNASASVLIKIALMPPRKALSFTDPISALMNWPLWLGLGLYGTAFVLYAIALVFLPLNVVQPVLTSGAIVVVAVISILLFKEPFNWTTGAGILFIIAGMSLITARVA
jgi:multidrug transporter EmrE-like cation transporter